MVEHLHNPCDYCVIKKLKTKTVLVGRFPTRELAKIFAATQENFETCHFADINKRSKK